jgi:hypothetical protein
MRLSELTRVDTGYHFRGSVEADPSGEFRVLQARDIDEYHRFDPEALTRVSLPGAADACRINLGDVLFLARGAKQYAVPVLKPVESTVVPNHFFLLRPRRSDVLAGYLAWYLNQAPAQAALRGMTQGSNVPYITKTQLGKIEVPLPDPTVQELISAVSNLLQHEQRLTAALVREREQLATALCLRAIDSVGGPSPLPAR